MRCCHKIAENLLSKLLLANNAAASVWAENGTRAKLTKTDPPTRNQLTWSQYQAEWMKSKQEMIKTDYQANETFYSHS